MATETTTHGPQVCLDCGNKVYCYQQWFEEPCTGGNEMGHHVPDWTKLLVGMVCPECRQNRPEDDRVAAGMRCAECAGYTTRE